MSKQFGWLLGITLLILNLAAEPYQSGGTDIQFLPKITYRFGEYLNISGKITPSLPIKEAYLFVSSSPTEHVASPLNLDSQQSFVYQHDFKNHPLKPFARLSIWLELSLQDGQTIRSEIFDFRYEDNRFPWKTREQPPFSLHWREGDLEFAQSALDVAFEAKDKILNQLPLQTPDHIDIYIYGTPGDLRQALQLSQDSWVGAHADPIMNVVLLSIRTGPDQRLQLESQIPHELMHIFLYNSLPNHYDRLPYWLTEGLATNAELYPNPDYFILLQNASEDDSFIPLSTLCNSFPQDPSQAFLAYAQSSSIVQFLIENFGTSKLIDLLNIYQQEMNCDAGLQAVYGLTQDELQRQWRSEKFGAAPINRALTNFLPWAIILILALGVPILISIRSLFAHRIAEVK
jgi:hypothetical protein